MPAKRLMLAPSEAEAARAMYGRRLTRLQGHLVDHGRYLNPLGRRLLIRAFNATVQDLMDLDPWQSIERLKAD